MPLCAQTGGGSGQQDNKSWELRSTAKVSGVGGGERRLSSCAKWLAVLKQKCVFQQKM